MSAIKPLHVALNAMFGPVAGVIQKMNLPIKLTMLNEIPDGTFPKGPPDPLLKENQKETEELIISSGADLGAAWDGDADRFFLFDETGRWISGYYVTAFLGTYFAEKFHGAKIIHDPRLTWATEDAVIAKGGIPLENRVGHAFIKERMRKEDAVFAGEMSGHYYFKDYFYMDNGIIPFLMILEMVSKSNKKVSELFEPFFSNYPVSGEINIKVSSTDEAVKVLAEIEEKYHDAKFGRVDGLSIEYPDWRANIRASNTEPLLRVNVEARNEALTREKTGEIMDIVKKFT
jgi:phosphomannomutase